MKKFFEEAIKNIDELMNLRFKQIDLLNKLDKSQDANVLYFKIKNYKVWLETLQKQIEKDIKITTKEDITNLNLASKKLETHLIELLETGEIKDIDDTKNEIQELERQIGILSDTMIRSVNSNASHNDSSDNSDTETETNIAKQPTPTPIPNVLTATSDSNKKPIKKIKKVV